MEIILSNAKKIFTVQQEFAKLFPYLRIEFFLIPHPSAQETMLRFLISSTKTIGESRKKDGEAQVFITPSMTVAELEQQVKTVYGFGVQVFRNSGKVWLEATFTDGWTLEEQNREGQMLSKSAG